MKISYKPMVADTDIVIRRGMIGAIENNQTNAFFGEWIVFKYYEPDNESEVNLQIRMPLEYAIEHKLIVPEDKFQYDSNDEEPDLER